MKMARNFCLTKKMNSEMSYDWVVHLFFPFVFWHIIITPKSFLFYNFDLRRFWYFLMSSPFLKLLSIFLIAFSSFNLFLKLRRFGFLYVQFALNSSTLTFLFRLIRWLTAVNGFFVSFHISLCFGPFEWLHLVSNNFATMTSTKSVIFNF